ncbi:hypothetical protein D3C77_632810 [compost metagenome]
MARLEVALLVEHPVIGQLLLVVGGQQLAVGDHRRRVVALVVLQPRVADHQVDAAHFILQAAQALLDAQLHARTQQQVLGRVAAQRQFGKQDDIRLPLIAGAGSGLDQALDVAVHIADTQIQLGHHDPQGLAHGRLHQ